MPSEVTHEIIDGNTFEMVVDAIAGVDDVIISYHTKQEPWEHFGFKLSFANASKLAAAIAKAVSGK